MASAMAGDDAARLPESLASLLRSCASQSNAQVPGDIDDPSSSAHAQLLSLTSHSLSDLRTQPAALITAKAALETQLSTLCSRHVGSFVRVHAATSSLPSALDRLDEQLTTLIDIDLPALSQAAQRFPEQIKAPADAKDRARNLLDQYDLSLKDLLDIPRLLMTCARANHPIEALQLGTHMARIARSNVDMGHRSTLLKALKQECWVHLTRLREDLLRGLGARGVRLPSARRYVSLLQRLHEVDEAGSTGGATTVKEDTESAKLGISPSCVCLSFLRSRWVLVEELGAHDTDDDPITLLESQISSWRDVVGDSCTVALALFGDATVGRSAGGTELDELSPLTLIAAFGYRAMSKLEQLTARSLPRLDGSTGSLQSAFETLASLHTQLSYAAASLSRQGLDFSDVSEARIAFEVQALHLWSKGLALGIQAFEEEMAKGSTLSVKELTGSADARALLSVDLEQLRRSFDWSAEAARFPPVATLVNGVLDAHEALLSFAPLSIGVEALKQFDVAISDCVTQSLESFRKIEGDPSATDPNVRLDALLPDVSDAPSTDRRRAYDATLAISARLLTALCGSIIPAIRQLLLETFESEQATSQVLASALQDALSWCREVDERWRLGEQARRTDAERQEQDRLAAVAEEEARRAAEKKVREEEQQLEAERAERVRIEGEQRRREEEAAAAEAAALEQRRREEEEALRLQQQQEEEAKRQKQAEEQKRKVEEDERQRRVKAAEEAERRKQEEQVKAEELRRKEQAEAEERKKKEEVEAEERRKREQVEAEEREERKRVEAEEQREREHVEAERKRKEEVEAAEERNCELEAEKERQKEAEMEQKREEAAKEERKQKMEDERALAASKEKEMEPIDGTESKEAEEAKDEDKARKTLDSEEEQRGPQEGKDEQFPDKAKDTVHDDAGTTPRAESTVEAETAAISAVSVPEHAQGGVAQGSADVAAEDTRAPEPPATTAASIRASKLAEKLKKRQEDRERAAAAKAKANDP